MANHAMATMADVLFFFKKKKGKSAWGRVDGWMCDHEPSWLVLVLALEESEGDD